VSQGLAIYNLRKNSGDGRNEERQEIERNKKLRIGAKIFSKYVKAKGFPKNHKLSDKM
jgi:hypothetical protein